MNHQRRDSITTAYLSEIHRAATTAQRCLSTIIIPAVTMKNALAAMGSKSDAIAILV